MSLGAGMLLGNILGCLFFIPPLRAHFPGEPWLRASRPQPELLRYSLPLAGAELVSGILGRLDLWMILLLLGPEKAAIYAVLITITNGLRTVRQTFDPLLIPIVSALKPEELHTRLKPSFSYATNMVSTLQLFIACFILVFPREILSLAGKEYTVEIFAFALLLVGNLVNGFLGMNGQVLLGLGKSRLVLQITASALVLNLIGNWIFIPRWGIPGAALAASLTLLYQNVVHYAYVRFVRKLKLYERHLYLNAGLEIVFLAAFFAAYQTVTALSLPTRIGVFSTMAALLGLTVFLKRKSYKLGS
jgi:O-antigen/teichoic acid export membrane protein